MSAFPPLPVAPPFLSIVTPTHRPQALARCMASVRAQTAVDDLEHLVVPDYVGYGIVQALYGRMRWIAPAVRGEYVYVMCDDDVFVDAYIVEQLRAAASSEPHVIVARVIKGGREFPRRRELLDPPEVGRVDLAQRIVRRDVWLRHLGDYGMRYAGDYDYAKTLWDRGYTHAPLDRVIVEGGASGHPVEAIDA